MSCFLAVSADLSRACSHVSSVCFLTESVLKQLPDLLLLSEVKSHLSQLILQVPQLDEFFAPTLKPMYHVFNWFSRLSHSPVRQGVLVLVVYFSYFNIIGSCASN